MEKERAFADAGVERTNLAAALLMRGNGIEARRQFCLAGSDLIRECADLKKGGLGERLIPTFLGLAMAEFDIAHKISISMLRQG